MNRLKSLMLAVLLALMAAFMTASCSGKTAALLDEVEGYMQQRPDSALSVLTAIPQESLLSDRLRARWSLLYAMALDKSYVDTNDVSIIAPAVKYYSRHGSAYDKMRTYHYQGVIYKNAEDYPNAIISLTEASKYIDDSGDFFQGGLVYSSLAHLYNRMYNAEEELEYATRAYDCFVKAGDHDYIQYAMVMRAYALANLNRNEEAIELYRNVLADNPDKALCLSFMQLSAQNGYDRGYAGNVGIRAGIAALGSVGYTVGLETVHGFNFGNGAFIGGGLALNGSLGSNAIVDGFVETKYNLFDTPVSPFVAVRGVFP